MHALNTAILFVLAMTTAYAEAFGSDTDAGGQSAASIAENRIEDGPVRNAVQNSRFERGKAFWVLAKYNGGQAVFALDTVEAIEGRCSAQVSVERASGEPADIQLLQPFPVQPLTEYLISFRAWVADTTTITLSIANDARRLWSLDLVLIPGEHSYGPYRYFSEDGDPFGILAFQLGRNREMLKLDNVVAEVNSAALAYNKQASKPGLNINPYSAGVLHLEIPFAHAGEVPVVVTNADGKLMASDVIPPGNTGVQIMLPSDLLANKQVELVFLVYIGERVVTRRVASDALLPPPAVR